MDSRQQKLIRHDLKSLISIPIFNTFKLEQLLQDKGTGPINPQECFLGILNVDSES